MDVVDKEKIAREMVKPGGRIMETSTLLETQKGSREWRGGRAAKPPLANVYIL